jgi:hypothetical protein
MIGILTGDIVNSETVIRNMDGWFEGIIECFWKTQPNGRFTEEMNFN